MSSPSIHPLISKVVCELLRPCNVGTGAGFHRDGDTRVTPHSSDCKCGEEFKAGSDKIGGDSSSLRSPKRGQNMSIVRVTPKEESRESGEEAQTDGKGDNERDFSRRRRSVTSHSIEQAVSSLSLMKAFTTLVRNSHVTKSADRQPTGAAAALWIEGLFIPWNGRHCNLCLVL